MTSGDGGGDRFVEMLGVHRAEAEQLLEEQRLRLDQLEAELLTAVEQLAAQLDEQNDESLNEQRRCRQQALELEQQGQNLLRLKEQLTAQQAHWRELETMAAERQQRLAEQLAAEQADQQARAAALDEREATLAELRREATHAQQAAAEAADEITRQKERLIEKESRLDAAIEQAEQRAADTRRQRRRIAEELRQQREALRLDRQKTADDGGAQLAVVEQERDDLRAQMAGSEQELNDLTDKLAELAEQVHQLSLVNAELQEQGDADQLDSLRQQLDELEAENASLREASQDGAAAAELEQELDRLSRDNVRLIERLTTADARIAELERTAAQDGSHDEKFAELKKRFAMAVDDVRSLKRRNAELEEKLTQAGVGKPAEDAFDWESQKQRLIASLESDFDPDDEAQQAERLTAEGTIRITDEIVSRKDREIAELKQLLDEQSSNLGNLAVGATAIQATLDSDELIRQERENLARMREEMREKLRKAEIDISLERAKLARERAELEERLISLQHEQSKHSERGGEAEEPARGRWLARMGLKNDEPEKK